MYKIKYVEILDSVFIHYTQMLMSLLLLLLLTSLPVILIILILIIVIIIIYQVHQYVNSTPAKHLFISFRNS